MIPHPPYGGFSDIRHLVPYVPQAPHQFFGAQAGVLGSVSLGLSAQDHPDPSLVAVSTVVSASDLAVCGSTLVPPVDLLSQPGHNLDRKSYRLHAWRL